MRPKLVARFAFFATFAILTLHLGPASAGQGRQERGHGDGDGDGGGGGGGVGEHRLRHRYRSSGAARDFRDLHAHGLGLCSRCPPGFGVARRCTPVRDTVCHSCPPGYYAPGYSRKHSCWPCSRCGNGLYEAHPCTGTSDTICDACPPPSDAVAPGGIDAHGRRQCRHLSNNSSQHNNNEGVAALTDANKSASHHQANDATPPANGNTLETLPASTLSSYSFAEPSNDEEVAIGVTQIVAFQIVLIFTTVATILALTCRLRVFTNHETRFKIPESYRKDDGVALIEHLSETS